MLCFPPFFGAKDFPPFERRMIMEHQNHRTLLYYDQSSLFILGLHLPCFLGSKSFFTVLVDVRCCCSIFPINALHFIKGARVQWFNFLKFLLLTVKSQNLERGPAPYRGQELETGREGVKEEMFMTPLVAKLLVEDLTPG